MDYRNAWWSAGDHANPYSETGRPNSGRQSAFGTPLPDESQIGSTASDTTGCPNPNQLVDSWQSLVLTIASALGTVLLLPLSSKLLCFCLKGLCGESELSDEMEVRMVCVDIKDSLHKTDTRASTPTDQSTAPPSPIVIPRHHDVQSAYALDTLQRKVMTAHIRLARGRSFCPQLCFSIETLTPLEWDIINHPIQDAMGSLFVTLLTIRRNRPTGVDAFLPAPYHKQLTQAVRREAAARYSAVFKFYAHTLGMPHLNFVRSLMEEFLLPEELGQYQADWQREVLRLQEAECAIVKQEPLLSLVNMNPLTIAETMLFDEVKNKSITKMEALIMRGTLFFFLGSCLLNKHQDILEGLDDTVNMDTVAEALVAVAHTCRFAARSPSILYKPNCEAIVDQVAVVLLDNAMDSQSRIIRTGPYAETLGGVPPDGHPVRKMVDPSVLKTARAVYVECIVT